MKGDNPYVVLGLAETSTHEEIAARYRKLIKENHPDRNQNDPAATDRMKRINLAYGQLRTPEGRKAVDEKLTAAREKAQRLEQARLAAQQRERLAKVMVGVGLGALVVGGVAAVVAASDSDSARPSTPNQGRGRSRGRWDPNVQRVRGRDGRFVSG